MKWELSLLSSCPKLSEFRKEHTVTVSATFYFGPGRPKTIARKRDSKVPIQSLLPPRIQVISHLSSNSAHNSEQLSLFYPISHLHCLPNGFSCFGLLLYFLFCLISNLPIQVSLPHCFNDWGFIMPFNIWSGYFPFIMLFFQSWRKRFNRSHKFTKVTFNLSCPWFANSFPPCP